MTNHLQQKSFHNTSNMEANTQSKRIRKAKPSISYSLSPSTKTFFDKASDLESLRLTVVDAANVGAGLWFSYIFVLLYLFVAVGSVTHKDLFLQSPIKLPFLNIELPLLGFFALGPLLFLIVHGYVLLHLVLLAGKVGAFQTELKLQLQDYDIARDSLRRQLPSNIFVQKLAGPREIRRGIVGVLLKLIAQCSLVFGPIALLVFFLLQFLPYHHEWITWWHRVTLLIDFGLLWFLWPPIARGYIVRLRDLWGFTAVLSAIASTYIVVSAFTIATFPGEALHEWRSIIKIPTYHNENGNWQWVSVHDLLIVGEIDLQARSPKNIWSNRLVLPAFDGRERFKNGASAEGVNLSNYISQRKRDLRGAVLIGAVLNNADLTAANLQEAKLDQAELKNAKLVGAQLQGASFENAQLQGATLDGASIQDATLIGVKLQGASLTNAVLKGASLNESQLQGASFDSAQLQGATLSAAELQSASLAGAQLQGANLTGTQLQGAFLGGAQLQGTSFDRARLQGASLVEANLKGASFFRAQLQGTSFAYTRLSGVSFDGAEFWRTNSREIIADLARFVRINIKELTSEQYKALEFQMHQAIPDGKLKTNALQRITILNPISKNDGNEYYDDVWRRLSNRTVKYDIFLSEVIAEWRRIGCDTSGSPYILRRLVQNLNDMPTVGAFGFSIFAATTDEEVALRNQYLNKFAEQIVPDNCESLTKLQPTEISAFRAYPWK